MVKKETRKTAKKSPAKKASTRRVAVPEPGTRSPAASKDYLEMTRVLMAAVPERGAVAQDALFEAARHNTSRKQFPGDTHRMWAEHVLADLESKGVLVSDGNKPATWRRR